MSAVTVQLMEWKYALPERAKKKKGWHEHVSHNCADNELDIHTRWELKVTGTSQP